MGANCELIYFNLLRIKSVMAMKQLVNLKVDVKISFQHAMAMIVYLVKVLMMRNIMLNTNLSGQEIPVLLNHRVIFGEVQGEGEDEKKRKCLYWEEDLKKWRLGQCLAIGFKFFSVGYALQIEDSTLQKCAVDLDGWVKGSSNEIVEGGSLVGVQTFSSGASEVQSQTATASLTYVTTNGASFQPKCEWKLRRGRFRCVKPRKKNKVLPNL